MLFLQKNSELVLILPKISYLSVAYYGERSAKQGSGYLITFYDIMIKILNTNEIGIFITEVTTSFDCTYSEKTGIRKLIFSRTKGQQKRGSSCRFYKYDINKEIKSVPYVDYSYISASPYLFDSKCPLKYSLQNVFDQNPATSYVENTKDDLMKINISFRYDKLMLINGYAQNIDLYMKNNRIKSIIPNKIDRNEDGILKDGYFENIVLLLLAFFLKL